MTSAALDATDWARRVAGDVPGRARVVVVATGPVELSALRRVVGRPLLDVFATLALLDDASSPTSGPWAARRGASARDYLGGRRVVVVGRDAWTMLDLEACRPGDGRLPDPLCWIVIPQRAPGEPAPSPVLFVPGRSARAWLEPGLEAAGRRFWTDLVDAEAARLDIPRDAEGARRAVVRLAAQLGGDALAALAGVAPFSVTRWINGSARPGPNARRALARLGVPESAWAQRL